MSEPPAHKHPFHPAVTAEGFSGQDDIFFAAVEMTRMPMIVTDPNQADNPIVFANVAFLELTGYTTEEILGRNCRFLQGEDTDRDTVSAVRNAIEKRTDIAVELLNYRKDGSAFWNALFVSPVFDGEGKLLYFFASQLDVSRRRDAEDALRQAQKMEAVGQLTGGIAHDFNNLLGAILGSLELVRKRLPYDPRITPLLENAVQGAERGATLTRRMLAFARKQDLQMEAVDLSVLVRGMFDFIQRTIGAGVQMTLDFPADLPRVLTDANQLEAAVLNLVVNARDAMPSGGTVTMSADLRHLDQGRGELSAGAYVVLCVADTGQGMPPEILARASEPFFTTKGVGKGTGLGLSMVHGLTAQSGGTLAIESTPGKGTRIELWFPATTTPAATEQPGPSRQSGPIDRAGLVLVVDDDNLVLMNTAAMLEDLGRQVLTAASGEEALSHLAARPEITLVVTDEVMPGMTGTELARRIREGGSVLPIILATGYADLGERPVPQKPGLPRLAKPFTQAQLAHAVATALSV